MRFGRYFLLAAVVMAMGHNHAAELKANLTSQIELLPSCKINDQHYAQDHSGIHWGEINFGDMALNHRGALQATLKNDYLNRIKIECSDQTLLSVTFGAGQNDQHIPAQMKNNYFHAMSNGQHFIAYNLLHGSDKQVIKPQQAIHLPNDQKIFYLQLYGQVELAPNQMVSRGNYTDLIPMTIKF
ncbi:spore coat protein U domain-containing protein [Acinetobacter larvae]|uniref:Spore coat protein U/FanG domain-containing protein n=1 Tax=Acinetobacter larvae TaxID=1789224 RepID=A0A1B2LVS5_9GAMM|nr:spore coat protein U domain-containing protein [Acinetobacter larvae]AOA57051.1 hypothetical protein BFG52_00895 [Acinetobacter larvae]